MKLARMLSRDTGEEVESHLAIRQSARLPHNRLRLNNGVVTALCDQAVCFEAYNPMDEEIYFTEMIDENFPLHPLQKILIKPKEWGFLPHGYFVASTKSGRPVTITKNYGSTKFTGNKYPSRPS